MFRIFAWTTGGALLSYGLVMLAARALSDAATPDPSPEA